MKYVFWTIAALLVASDIVMLTMAVIIGANDEWDNVRTLCWIIVPTAIVALVLLSIGNKIDDCAKQS